MNTFYKAAMTAMNSGDISAAAAVKLYLANGMNVNAADPDEAITLLHLAVENERNMTVSLLLRHGADPNAIDDESCTPLHYAAEVDSAKLVDRLVRNGAYIDAVDEYGNTPLHLAAMLGRRNALTALLMAGASTVLTNSVGCTALEVAPEGDKPLFRRYEPCDEHASRAAEIRQKSKTNERDIG
jgi:ankyrin repeat protein